jgi:5-hydroxyisourate hydrolase-like protein (transthyretin family)
MGKRLFAVTAILILIAVFAILGLPSGDPEPARVSDEGAAEVTAEPERRHTAPPEDAPTPVPEPVPDRAAITGDVRSMSGTPIVGATVDLVRSSAGAGDGVVASADAGSGGSFTLDASSWIEGDRVLARAPGYGAVSTGAAPGDALRLHLPAGAALAGVVFDEATGEGIEGALVEVDLQHLRHPLVTRTTTDAEGRYRFDHLRPWTVRMRVRAEGFRETLLTTEIRGGSARQSVPMVRDVPGDVEGDETPRRRLIVTGEGAPIEGARVIHRTWGGFGADPTIGVTDGAGRVEFTAPVGRSGRPARVWVRATGWAPSSVELRPGEETRVELERGGVLRARFVADGEPVDRAPFYVQGGPRGRSMWHETAQTDDEGRVELSLDPGHYLAWMPATDRQQWRDEAVAVPVGDVIDLGTIELPPGVELVGRVVSSAGEPIAGVEVNAVPKQQFEGYMGDAGEAITWTTDRDGRFRVPGLCPGKCDVVVRATGWIQQAFDEIPVANELNVVLEPFVPAITGRVLDPDGEPPMRALVRVLVANAGRPPRQVWREELIGTDGRFETLNLSGGGAADYTVIATSGERVAVAIVDATPVEVRLELGVAGGVRLRLLEPDGSPAVGVAVSLIHETAGVAASERAIPTDAEGRVRMSGLATGEWVLRVTTDASALHRSVVRVTPGAEIEETVRLTAGGRVSVRVVDASGTPIQAADVVLRDDTDEAHPVRSDELHRPYGAPPRDDPRGTTMRTPATGVVTAKFVAPGTFRVLVSRRGYRLAEAQAVVTEGSTAAVEVVLEED